MDELDPVKTIDDPNAIVYEIIGDDHPISVALKSEQPVLLMEVVLHCISSLNTKIKALEAKGMH